MTEPTQELGQFLQSLNKSYENFKGLGIANYETFTKEVWNRERLHNGKWDREPAKDYTRKLHISLAPIRAMVGANDTGKTYWNIAEIIMHATGRYPVWYPEAGKLKQPNSGRVIVGNFDIIGDVWEPKLKLLLPKADLKGVVKHPQHKVVIRYEFKNGSVFHFKTHNEDLEEYRGWKIFGPKGGWLSADEPCPQDRWDESLKGVLLYGGRIWITATLLEKHVWILDAIYSKPPYPESDVLCVYPTIFQNPYKSNEDIELFKRGLTDKRYLPARLYGKPLFLSGLIFPEFDMQVHVIKKFDISGDAFTRYMMVDPHPSRPTYIAWYATNGKFHYKYDEIEVDSRSYKNVVTAIRDAESKYLTKEGNPAEISLRVIDPHFARQPGKAYKTVILDFSNSSNEIKYPMTFIDEIMDSSVDRGEIKIANMLYYDITQPISTLNSPQYFIFDNCGLTLTAYTHYGYERPQDIGERDRMRRTEKYKHYIDCYSDDTEVLTKTGWKYFQDVSYNDLIATRNKKGFLEYQKPTDKFYLLYAGDMIHLKSKKIDLLVTPNHKMLVDKWNCYKHLLGEQFIKAEDLNIYQDRLVSKTQWKGKDFKHWIIPKITKPKTSNAIKMPAEDWFEFLGWFLSEGACIQRTGHQMWEVIISQDKNSRYFNEIENLLKRLPWHFNYYGHNFVIQSKQLWKHLKPLGNVYTKTIPLKILSASSRLLTILWKSYVKGDGWTQRGIESIATVSKGLIDGLQELAMKCNKVMTIRYRDIGNWKMAGRSGKSERIYSGCQRHSQHVWLRDGDNQSKIFKENYNGKIVCLTVPNHTFYVRRNGKPIWSGNCDRYYFESNPQHYSVPAGKRTIDQIRGEREHFGHSKDKRFIRGYNA